MAKLYFRYGTVGSAKTLNLLAVAHNYRQQGKSIVLLKPELDIRFGKESIKSRAGLEMTADLLVSAKTELLTLDWEGVNCILVDEAQFLSALHIEELRQLTLTKNIPVICYGLRSDFKTRLFEGSKRLMELADSIEEVKATCHYCQRKSIVNLKHVDGKAVLEGPTVELGAEEKYYPVCFNCYAKQLMSDCKNPAAYLRPDLPAGHSAERVGIFKQAFKREHEALQDKDGSKMQADFCNQTLDLSSQNALASAAHEVHHEV